MQKNTKIPNLVIRKYGGACLATSDKIKQIAIDIVATYQTNPKILLVVSAMGTTTNELFALAQSISENPVSRELDMLLSAGERISAALLAMAINDLGVPAISFTGSQAGILTSGVHNNASIEEIKPLRVEEELSKNKVVILAGFQGVNAKTKDITTLGRGGSDTTAVALAHYFGAEKLELIKEVDGVYSSDPKIDSSAEHYEYLSFDELIDITDNGAKIVHNKAARLAKELNVELHIGYNKKTIVRS